MTAEGQYPLRNVSAFSFEFAPVSVGCAKRLFYNELVKSGGGICYAMFDIAQPLRKAAT